MAGTVAVVNGQAITEDTGNLETWRNATRGRVVIKRVGPMGATRDDMIGAGKTFHLTPQDRRLNQQMAAEEELDVFTNGTLVPVEIDESSEDYRELVENPNLLNDAQIAKLFKANDDVFAERISEIKNATTLERLHDLASQDETGARVSQLKMLDARLRQVQPTADEIRQVADRAPARGEAPIKAVTPK